MEKIDEESVLDRVLCVNYLHTLYSLIEKKLAGEKVSRGDIINCQEYILRGILLIQQGYKNMQQERREALDTAIEKDRLLLENLQLKKQIQKLEAELKTVKENL